MESAEHQFLKTEFLKVLDHFSSLNLYGFTETSRKKFDFSCTLKRDLARPLVGQTLWSNYNGIEKDMRILISDTESEIKVYLAKDVVKYRSTFEEIINDFRKTEFGKELFKIKSIWLPPDFDADRIADQRLIKKILQSRIVQDILFNVVFGNLSAENVDFF